MEITKKAPTAGSFKPGQSGNPGGRAKKTPEEFALIEACKKKAPEALAVILGIMQHGQSEKTRLSAAVAVIERGYGKPKQEQDLNLSGDVNIRSIAIEFVESNGAANK